MIRTAAILAGGESSRLRNKAETLFAGKPMILHVIDRCKSIVDELLVIVNTLDQEKSLSQVIGKLGHLRIVVDRPEQFLSSLLGARTAFENSNSEFTLLVPCDVPFIKTSVLNLLFDMINGWDAVVPRYPNGHIEPLHAIYRTDISRKIADDIISSGRRSMKDLLAGLNSLYLSTNIIKQLDPQLESFTNVNTINELNNLQRRIK
jgi:molybdopterin-guanine dinucleotide biosynthesis protein A